LPRSYRTNPAGSGALEATGVGVTTGAVPGAATAKVSAIETAVGPYSAACATVVRNVITYTSDPDGKRYWIPAIEVALMFSANW